jgi:hypothetical protein
MASDRIVTARHILQSLRELQQRGSKDVLSELEKLEPDLMEHLLESLTQMHSRLANSRISFKAALRAYRQAEATTLVCIMALRRAYQDLWGEDEAAMEEPWPEHPEDPPTPTG